MKKKKKKKKKKKNNNNNNNNNNKKKKKLVEYKLVQAIQASIQNKVTGKRGTRVTTGEQPAVTSPVTATASKKESIRSDINNNRRLP
jgi:hypothetical protein